MKILDAYLTPDNILHYTVKEKGEIVQKQFDVGNENVKKQAIPAPKGIGRTIDGVHYAEHLPVEVCKALLKTGEYRWTRGDKFTDFYSEVYHRCWEVNKDKPNYENIEHCGNVSSNPCYGWIRYKLEPKGYTEHTECPRCESVYAIYNTYRPFKYKVWDLLLWVRDFFHWRIFHHIYKDAETFFFAKSKEGREILCDWQEAIEEGEIGCLAFWRKHYLPFLLRNSFIKTYTAGDCWYLYDPNQRSEEDVKEAIATNAYKIIWEYYDHKEKKDDTD